VEAWIWQTGQQTGDAFYIYRQVVYSCFSCCHAQSCRLQQISLNKNEEAPLKNKVSIDNGKLSRRRFLGGATAVVAATLISPRISAKSGSQVRSLAFYHTHTGESLDIVYHDGSNMIGDALAAINRYLRDFRSDEVHPIDAGLLHQLHSIRSLTGNRGTFEVISAYRSPDTNAMLGKKSNGVAKRSLHMEGKAIDVRLSGVDTPRLRDAALALKAGGVGYYHKSDFVHVDTGRVRTW